MYIYKKKYSRKFLDKSKIKLKENNFDNSSFLKTEPGPENGMRSSPTVNIPHHHQHHKHYAGYHKVESCHRGLYGGPGSVC